MNPTDNVNPTDSVISKMAVGYEPDGSVAPLYDLGWVGPAGQMFSTTTDLNTVSILGDNGEYPAHYYHLPALVGHFLYQC